MGIISQKKRKRANEQRLAVIGAGPKGLAIAAKANVLKQLGFATPEIVLFEKNQIAYHWREGSGYTNGRLPLGTSPDKDVGFPYYSFCWGDSANRKVNYLTQKFSWQSFLIDTHQFADWIDRGRPSPVHHEWAAYLEWVYQLLSEDITLRRAEVTEVDIENGQWVIRGRGSNHTQVEERTDGIVFTGPGHTKLPFDVPEDDRILKNEVFWNHYREYLHNLDGAQVGLVGSGENAATIAVVLGQANPSMQLEIISSSAMNYTRGESYVENHLYTDPFQGNWLQLTRSDRIRFIGRTDRGVFSVTTKKQLDRMKNVEVIPGKFRGVRIDSLNQITVDIEYNRDKEERIYDLLILATGFDHAEMVSNLLSPAAHQFVLEKAGVEKFNSLDMQDRVDECLAIEGVEPYLHLPMLSGLSQGPGFPNLSCLGRLSDHVLARYVPIDSRATANRPILITFDETSQNP